jgi:quercetin dioxygenase-like cupin family protein
VTKADEPLCPLHTGQTYLPTTKGCSNLRHIHYNCEEVLYVLRGKVEHTMGDERAILEPGDTLVVAAGVPHGATNIGDDDVDAIIAYSSGIRDMVLES